MSNYKVIDDLVATYKHGQESPKNSPERARGRAACEMLVVTFKPLILSTLQRMPGTSPADYEDAYQDGVVAFMEGLKKYDKSSGGCFNAFIKTHLRHYFMKRQEGRFEHSIKPVQTLDAPAGEGLPLSEVVADDQVDIETDYCRHIQKKYRYQRLRTALEHLNPNQKEVICQHYGQGISLQQIARNKGCCFNAIKDRHNQALKKIKKFL